MEQVQVSTKAAGVDVGKRRLDVSVYGVEGDLTVENTTAGICELIGWLRAREVGRVGMEATGGYERLLRASLEAAGFEVVVHQPIEVRRFAQLTRRRAKTDKLDARLIAAATCQVEAVRAAQDPRLLELADLLTAYEHATDQATRTKTFLEQVSSKTLAAELRAKVRSWTTLKARLALRLMQKIKVHADLLVRYRLLVSLPGVGPIVAATLLVRMPELGGMKRGQAASLIGVAPFARESGQWNGVRFISGGRARPRRMLYLAALQARRCDPTFKAVAEGLTGRGKPTKVAIVAVMRRLIEAANLILSRGQPWLKAAAT